ncbi:hypothetical protein [Nocardia sp. CA-119907]|uniref:hypothetical protein n=1 Tax=Nocardia sp. CA-119907 TaxID=3239973 RepID=UPI003D99891C
MTGARTRRARRITEAMPLVSMLRAHGHDCDNMWWTRRDSRHDWFELTTPLSINDRGDTPVNESNFAVAESRIDEVSAFGVSFRYDLWPGGTIRTLVVRGDDAAALAALDTVLTALADSAVLDDEDVARREWDENHPDGGERECRAGEGCQCVYRTHQHVLDVRDDGATYPWCGVCFQDVEAWDDHRYDHRDPRPQPQKPHDEAQMVLFAT